jgi:hypothetical protein
MEKRMNNQWSGFSDFEIAELAFNYGLGDTLILTFSDRFKLTNRSEVEEMLTLAEYDMAFGE